MWVNNYKCKTLIGKVVGNILI